jgi:hypothetical protein
MMPLPPNDGESLEECRRMAADLNLESQRVGKEIHDRLIIAWTHEIGSARIQRLLASRANAEEAVHDADAALRSVALNVLTHCWGPDDRLTNACEHLALTDPDESVRDSAAYCLGVIVQTAPDMRVAHALASIVRDELQPIRVRETAYDALFWLHFIMTPKQSLDDIDRSLDDMERHSKEREGKFIDRLDWALVDYFIQRG